MNRFCDIRIIIEDFIDTLEIFFRPQNGNKLMDCLVKKRRLCYYLFLLIYQQLTTKTN